MSERDPIQKIIAPFLIGGICQDEAEALQMLAMDDVQRQVRRDAERVEHFRAFDQTSMEEFAQHVTARYQGLGRIRGRLFLSDMMISGRGD